MCVCVWGGGGGGAWCEQCVDVIGRFNVHIQL